MVVAATTIIIAIAIITIAIIAIIIVITTTITVVITNTIIIPLPALCEDPPPLPIPSVMTALDLSPLLPIHSLPGWSQTMLWLKCQYKIITFKLYLQLWALALTLISYWQAHFDVLFIDSSHITGPKQDSWPQLPLPPNSSQVLIVSLNDTTIYAIFQVMKLRKLLFLSWTPTSNSLVQFFRFCLQNISQLCHLSIPTATSLHRIHTIISSLNHYTSLFKGLAYPTHQSTLYTASERWEQKCESIFCSNFQYLASTLKIRTQDTNNRRSQVQTSLFFYDCVGLPRTYVSHSQTNTGMQGILEPRSQRSTWGRYLL